MLSIMKSGVKIGVFIGEMKDFNCEEMISILPRKRVELTLLLVLY